jgi:hypothetical protein
LGSEASSGSTESLALCTLNADAHLRITRLSRVSTNTSGAGRGSARKLSFSSCTPPSPALGLKSSHWKPRAQQSLRISKLWYLLTPERK